MKDKRSIWCTDQMPRKPNLLPRKCPLCKREHGTCQFVIGSGGLIVRIGHYSPAIRHATVSSNKTNPNMPNEEKKKLIKNSERKWCNFHSQRLERLQLFREWQDYHRFNSETRIPTTVKLTPQQKDWLGYDIAENGWGYVESHLSLCKRRELKNIDYYEKQLAATKETMFLLNSNILKIKK